MEGEGVFVTLGVVVGALEKKVVFLVGDLVGKEFVPKELGNFVGALGERVGFRVGILVEVEGVPPMPPEGLVPPEGGEGVGVQYVEGQPIKTQKRDKKKQ